MSFHWSLRDSKSPQASRTLLSILAVLNNVVVWMVSTRPPSSKSSSPFSNPLVSVPNAPITIGIIVTFIFHSFFNSLARPRYLSFFSHSFSFILWYSKVDNFASSLFFCWLLSGLLFWPRLGDPCVWLFYSLESFSHWWFSTVLTLNWIVLYRTVFDIETVLTVNRIVLYKTVFNI